MPAMWGMAAASMYSAYQGQQGAAAGQQASAAQSAQQLAAQKEWQKLSDPFSASGARSQFQQQYTPQLQALIADPTSVLQNPLYQAQQKQADQAVTRQQNATGNLNSGNELLALQQSNVGGANSFYQQQLSNLMQLSGQSSGAQQTAASNGMTPGMAYNQAAAPYASNASAAGTLAGLYGSYAGSQGGGGGGWGSNTYGLQGTTTTMSQGIPGTSTSYNYNN